MKRLAEIVDTIGVSRIDLENWLARQEFRTDFGETVRGKARMFTRDNVIELALVAAFVRAGSEPRRAIAWADGIRRNRHWSNLISQPAYFVTFARDFSTGALTDDLDPSRLVQQARELKAAPVWTVICVNEIYERVAALFGNETDVA